ncbi:class I SAM-dependent DNA methyltransferase [Ruegeria faecimaris]|uniref:class I SAM-dependent DNA methyltransferase n=1 Tax=Ruegeria faecimaris TaxID=686389 RepID=UPI00232EF3B4|nr:DNA methyltransferase [Ruegeria faecimaris]
MNAVEIEEAISELAEQPFDAKEFPYLFIQAFGAKSTTIKRLRKGDTNGSDLGGVLQRNNIHIVTCPAGAVTATLTALQNSSATRKGKVKFVLATDGTDLHAADMNSGEVVACEYKDFPDHFGFFLPLAGISTVKQIRESAFDIRATSRLNRLYVELLKHNPDWGTNERRSEMNHFMARLIFCFFAEDTEIFSGADLFTDTITKMSASDSSNTHTVISTLFEAMNSKDNTNLPRWAQAFPYVNGGLFSGSTDVPVFSKIARSYLLHIGSLDWTKINPDIFGSMIQAVADDEERGSLGMHYTSVPNILKVLNPLFLDDLRAKLEEAGNSRAKLKNLRLRMSKIRVFDPACGSGNFLVIAYKELRAIEFEINKRRGEDDRRTKIKLTNFRGIELREFPAEIARLALIIAEFQCDQLYRGQKEALAEFLPLDAMNWITCGNALRLDWLSICPPTGAKVKLRGEDLFMAPDDQAEIDFENEGGETFICGNPPYKGTKWQNKEQKDDMKAIFDGRVKGWKTLDYVAGWFIKAADFSQHTDCIAAFVSTNSVCQGQQVPALWPAIFASGLHIKFAHTSFKWANLASHNAGVTVAIVAISNMPSQPRKLFSLNAENGTVMKEVENINAYLVAGRDVEVQKTTVPICETATMVYGNVEKAGGHLSLEEDEISGLKLSSDQQKKFVRRFYGSDEFINAKSRYCLWIEDQHLNEAMTIPAIAARIEGVRQMRLSSVAAATRAKASVPHQFWIILGKPTGHTIVVPGVSSENRPYLPVGLLGPEAILSNRNFALYDAPLWNMALIASRLHWVWIGTVCVRMRTDFSYSNTLGWNTFPVPKLTQKNKDDLTRCAEDILLAREAHFPATIADLYDPEKMPENLRAAHDRNDDVLERIYIGRRFRNDTERLEKLFDLYTKMTTKVGAA